MIADRNANRIGLHHLATVYAQGGGLLPGCISAGDSTDHKTGLLPREGVTGNQIGHLIEIDPALHTARMPDLDGHG